MIKSNDKNFVLTSLLTIVLSSIGFALLHFGFMGYGYTFFILVPLCIGFFTGKITWKISSIFSVLIGLVAFSYLLVTSQLEGLFCVITLFPLILILVFVGAWIGWALKQSVTYVDETSDNDLKFSIYPLLLLLFSASIEHYFSEKYDYGKLESKLFLPYTKEVVFDYIKSVDTLDAEKPFLLHLGLSVPLKCILEKEEVGANRICYFKEGTIEEKVTEYERGKILNMDVTRYNLPGRKWLKFLEATYLFKAKGNGTVLTRISTYRTELKPRFYWKFWEEKAIEAEHEYVLNDLRNRLDGDAKAGGISVSLK